MSSVLKKTIKAYEKIAEKYNEINYDNSVMIEELTFFLENLQGDIVLDVGCGHGRDCEFLSQNGVVTIGLDLSVELLKIARKRSMNSSYLLADMRYPPIKEKTCNGLWVCASFHHIEKEDASETIRRFFEILVPEGIIFFSVKKGDFTGFENCNRYEGMRRFYSYYSNKEAIELLTNSGFYIISQFNDIDIKERNWVNIFATKL